MNEKQTQPMITIEQLEARRADIAAEIDRLQARLSEVEFWIRHQQPLSENGRLILMAVSTSLPIMTPAEEDAAKDRAIRAHAEELAKAAEDLIAWRDAGCPHQPKKGKVK